jgi:hypothetical protein
LRPLRIDVECPDQAGRIELREDAHVMPAECPCPYDTNSKRPTRLSHRYLALIAAPVEL